MNMFISDDKVLIFTQQLTQGWGVLKWQMNFLEKNWKLRKLKHTSCIHTD